MRNTNKYQLGLYELYKALSVSDLSEAELANINNILNLTPTIKSEINELNISDFPSDSNKSVFKKILNRIGDRILLINGGFPKNQTLGIEYYKLNKLLTLAKVLNTLILRTAALVVAEMLVHRADKYYFLNLSFEGYRIIYSVSMQLGNYKEFLRASDKFSNYLKYYNVEKDIEIEYYKLTHYSESPNINKSELTSNIEKSLARFSPYENKVPSCYFHLYYYYLQYLYYTHTNQPHKLYESAKKALHWFESLEFLHIPGRLQFTTIQIIYLIQTRDYDQVLPLIEKNKSLLRPYSVAWYRTIENEILLYFHKGDFDDAVKTFFQSQNKSTQVSRDKRSQETWLLYEAYVNLVLETESAAYDGRKKRFSIQKFINDLPQFSKDKRALNIPILIAQMLFFIVRNQYNKAIDRIESLEKYATRYLRNDETFRSNCFIKMLLEIPKNSFNQLQVERAADKYHRRLLDSDIDLIDQPFEIEIIPYEKLWDIIMDHLRPDHHYRPKKPRQPIS